MDQKAKIAEARKALLAKRLKGKATLAAKQEKIKKLDHNRPIPLSLAQQRFWITHQLDETQGSHNIYDGWRVSGPIDADRLNGAFVRLVGRHTTLQTRIDLIDGEPHQASHSLEAFALDEVDYSAVPEDKRGEKVDAFVKQTFGRPFNLSADPLVRLTLCQLNSAKTEHLLLLTIHHIISDEYSNPIIWRELAELYQNDGANLPEKPIDYRDFSDWQSEWLAKKAGQKQLIYWKEQLAGEVTSLQLPYDKVRPTVATGRGHTRSRQLPTTLPLAIGKLSKQTGATPFMVWMAIFQLLLYRYTQQEDVWVGTPIGNRQRPEVKNLIGLFLNTIVVRSQLDEKQTFVDLIKTVQEKILNAFANQDVPFDQVVNAVQPSRDSGLSPLFQTMLVYAQKGAGPQFKGLTFEKIDYKSDFAKLDLTLFVSGGDAPKASIQYSADLFEAETIDRMLGHLEVLATAVANDPATPIGHFPLLAKSEREQILVDWNESQPAPPTRGKVLHGLILKHGKVKPNHPAVIAGDKTLTYQELDLQSGNLARYLQTQGVNGKSNPFIGVMVDRRPEMLVGILAILRAGGAYVPIDPDYPAERIEHIVNDANLDIILTAGDYALPENIDRPIDLIDLTQPLKKQDVADLSQIVKPTPNSNAYLIYTSGSTGKPKGVMVSHGNIVHSTTARYSFYPTPAERFLLLSSFAFDSSMVGIFWTLCQGGTLILPEQGMHQNVGWLNNTIEEQKVTHLLALPSLYQILLEESESQQLQSLNTVMVAGEACHAGLVEMHYRRYPESSLYNEYGPTEGTVWSHAYRFPEEFVGPVVPIGKAIPNVTQYILDQNDQPVPVGVPGELVIGGAGITKGYLNRPDLTAEKFVCLPHLNPDENVHFYRTGDLVKWRADGNVIFLGRVDHQVKIRGFRIELGEIEALLLAHPAVKMGAVGVFEPSTQNSASIPEKKLVAWFTADSELDTVTLKDWIGKRLPNYMVPALFTQLDSMPLTP
ncbi:MAG: amino acid adenylation domain-containing protein, partial [Anaerolineae bacterium]